VLPARKHQQRDKIGICLSLNGRKLLNRKCLRTVRTRSESLRCSTKDNRRDFSHREADEKSRLDEASSPRDRGSGAQQMVVVRSLRVVDGVRTAV
jgi:hypothetical protein